MIKDMMDKLDPSQFGNQKGLSPQHYLAEMIPKSLSSLDNNSKRDIFAVIASFVDWKQAFIDKTQYLALFHSLKME